MTSILGIGQLAGRGTVLYTADTEPVVTLLAAEALFRDLSTTTADGDDVKALEENLVALGYGEKLTVDRHYDGATAAAVKRWEQDLKRRTPDGAVSVGEVVFLGEAAAVVGQRVSVGAKLDAGTPVLSLGTESRVVKAGVEVDDRENWAVNKVVELDWERDPKTGTVTEVGRDEVEGRIEIAISLPQSPDVPTGTEVDARVTTAEMKGVITVPVSAIVEGRDGSSVRLASRQQDDLTPVELGITADGLIEVTSGLQAGQEVRLPG